jgi:hypothetical protein
MHRVARNFTDSNDYSMQVLSNVIGGFARTHRTTVSGHLIGYLRASIGIGANLPHDSIQVVEAHSSFDPARNLTEYLRVSHRATTQLECSHHSSAL